MILGMMKKAVKCTSTRVDRLEKSSLVEVDQEKSSVVDIDRRWSTLIREKLSEAV